MKRPRNVTVIIPVYTGLAQVRRCLSSVLEARNQASSRVLIVYDCGPDPAVAECVVEYAEDPRVELLSNSANLGFVKTANRGMQLSAPDDVVLLNSDTGVSDGWLDKILQAADSDEQIATVTPMSNNGEIFSFPFGCLGDMPTWCDTALVNKILEQADRVEPVDAPTGVGFCMFIRRSALDEVGLFDESAFGLGYGEESDLCQRFARAGYRNVIAPNTWVYHEGGASFGDRKAKLIEKHSEIIRARYPNYFRDVHRFIRRDHLRAHRLQAALNLLAKGPVPCVVLISHGMGGGTARHVDELAACFYGRINFVLVEPQPKKRVAIKLPGWLWPRPIAFDVPTEVASFHAVVQALCPALVHVHHIKGLESLVLPLLRAANSPYIVTLHDFYLISSNPTLSDDKGRFDRNRLEPGWIQHDLAQGAGIEPKQWGAMANELLLNAEAVIAPSVGVKDIYVSHFQGLPVVLAEHPDAEAAGQYPPVRVPRENPVTWRVLCLGALGIEKGADVLESVAVLADRQNEAFEFHLAGYAYRPLNSAVKVHGPYRDAELKNIIRKTDPDFVWFPNLCAESYCYTLSAVLELGLPLICTDLGALSSRTTGRPLTKHVEPDMCAEDWLQELTSFARCLATSTQSTIEWNDQPAKTTFYADHYLPLVEENRRCTEPSVLEHALLENLLSKQPGASGLGEALVRGMIVVRDAPGLRALFNLVPIHVQRRIKRLLVRRPLHEIQLSADAEVKGVQE